jgi:hypothetical protein
MKKTLYKSTLALAVAVASTGAFAGSFDVDDGKTMLADEVFGFDSDKTLVDIPDTTFLPLFSTLLGLSDGQSVDDGDTWTIKYTLDSGVEFGEDLTNIDDWANQNLLLSFAFSGTAKEVVDGLPDPTITNWIIDVGGNDTAGNWVDECGANISVDAGGAIGDNTVSFLVEIEDDANAVVPDPGNNDGSLYDCSIDTDEIVRAGGFDVYQLKDPLERGTNQAVKLGVETLHNGSTADTAPAQEVLDSQYGIRSSRPRLTTYACGGGRSMISVLASETSFTGMTGCAAASDFATTTNSIDFGDYTIYRTMYNGDVVKDEDGQDFTFNANDTVTVVANTGTNWNGYSSVFLRMGTGSSCTGGGSDYPGVFNVGKTTATINLTGVPISDLESGFTFCGRSGAGTLSTTPSISLDMTVTYFDPRYTISEDVEQYGPVERNGCQVTLFNVPHPQAGDKAYIRLTNISDTVGGEVSASIWTQGGTQIDADSLLVSNLPAHATAVLTSDTSASGGVYPAVVYLGDSMTTYDSVTSGRHRIEVEGAFPACEAMGLIRTPAGVLTNMTSTTYAGDSTSWGGASSSQPANGTTNTSN